MKKKYIIEGIKYDEYDFCIYYYDEFYRGSAFYYEMHEDFYNELKSGKKPKYLILDDEDIDDDEYGEIEY